LAGTRDGHSRRLGKNSKKGPGLGKSGGPMGAAQLIAHLLADLSQRGISQATSSCCAAFVLATPVLAVAQTAIARQICSASSLLMPSYQHRRRSFLVWSRSPLQHQPRLLPFSSASCGPFPGRMTGTRPPSFPCATPPIDLCTGLTSYAAYAGP